MEPLQHLDRRGRQLAVGHRADHSLDPFPVDLGHQEEGAAVDHRLVAHGQDRGRRQAGFAERPHEAALARDVGGTGDPGARRRQAEDRLLTTFQADPVGEAGVPLGDAVDAQDPAPELALEVGLDGAHDSQSIPSRWAMSASAPTIRRSSLIRTTLRLV